MRIVSADITGSFILNSTDLTTTVVSSSIWSGSIAQRTLNLEQATASLNAATASLNAATASLYAATASIYLTTASLNSYTASNNNNIASLNAATASLLSYTSSLNARSSSFATTGSNTFTAAQVINSNLTVTGSITTTTLVVQTITSSVDFVTGSTRFGSKTSDTHDFTGSVRISGSLTSNGALSGTSATFSSLTSGYILKAGASGLISNSSIYDNGTGRVSVGTSNTYNSFVISNNATTGWEFGNDGSVITYNRSTSAYIPMTFQASSFSFTGAATFSTSVTASSVLVDTLSLGTDGTYGGTYKTLGFTGNTNGSHRIFAGTSDNLYIASATGRAIEFWTNGSSATRMFINTSGNVGIGTTSPNANLSIYSATTAFINFRNSTNIGTTYGFVIEATGNESELWNYANGYMRFGTNNTERMRITSGGNVGIGTTSPTTAKLVVYDSAAATSNVTLLDLKNGSDGGVRLLFSNSVTANLATITAEVQGTGAQTDDGNLIFSTARDAVATERMRLDFIGRLYLNFGNGTDRVIMRGNTGQNSPFVALDGGGGSDTAGAAAYFQLADQATANSRQWIVQIDSLSRYATFYYNGSSWTKVGYQTTGGTWTNSDQRRKENIELSMYGLNEVLQLTPKTFNYKIDEYKQKHLGFIAQDVLSIIPEAVQSDKDGIEQYYAMNYDNLVPVLVNAIKELNTKFEEYKATHP